MRHGGQNGGRGTPPRTNTDGHRRTFSTATVLGPAACCEFGSPTRSPGLVPAEINRQLLRHSDIVTSRCAPAAAGGAAPCGHVGVCEDDQAGLKGRPDGPRPRRWTKRYSYGRICQGARREGEYKGYSRGGQVATAGATLARAWAKDAATRGAA